MKDKKLLLISTLLLVICFTCIFTVFAHSGRTDSSGGHRDNSNQSSLGSYHYHCGGYPAHLHTGGVCPYTSRSSSASTLEELRKKYGIDGEISPTAQAYNNGYDDGYEKGKEYGEKIGHAKGFREGKAEGKVVGKAEGKHQAEKKTTKERWFTIPITIGIILFLAYKAFKKE